MSYSYLYDDDENSNLQGMNQPYIGLLSPDNKHATFYQDYMPDDLGSATTAPCHTERYFPGGGAELTLWQGPGKTGQSKKFKCTDSDGELGIGTLKAMDGTELCWDEDADNCIGIVPIDSSKEDYELYMLGPSAQQKYKCIEGSNTDPTALGCIQDPHGSFASAKNCMTSEQKCPTIKWYCHKDYGIVGSNDTSTLEHSRDQYYVTEYSSKTKAEWHCKKYNWGCSGGSMRELKPPKYQPDDMYDPGKGPPTGMATGYLTDAEYASLSEKKINICDMTDQSLTWVSYGDSPHPVEQQTFYTDVPVCHIAGSDSVAKTSGSFSGACVDADHSMGSGRGNAYFKWNNRDDCGIKGAQNVPVGVSIGFYNAPYLGHDGTHFVAESLMCQSSSAKGLYSAAEHRCVGNSCYNNVTAKTGSGGLRPAHERNLQGGLGLS